MVQISLNKDDKLKFVEMARLNDVDGGIERSYFVVYSLVKCNTSFTLTHFVDSLSEVKELKEYKEFENEKYELDTKGMELSFKKKVLDKA